MPLVLHLPAELLYYISKYLNDTADLSSWSRSCRTFHSAINPILYYQVKDDPLVMYWACGKGRVDTVQRLLDAGANPNVAWVQNDPTWWALRNVPNAPRFFYQPPSTAEGVRSPSQLEDPPLSQQTSDRANLHLDVADWLMSYIDIEYEMTKYFEPDYYEVGNDDMSGASDLDLTREEDGVDLLFWPNHFRWNSYKSFKTFPQQCYWTALHVAASRGNDKLVKLLLDNGADINAPSRLFCECAIPPSRRVAPLWTPLHISMCHGQKSTTRLLLSCGASTNVMTPYLGIDQHRFTALHSACALDRLDAALALVDGGHQIDVAVRDHNDLTPLAHAFFRGNWDMICFLVGRGADINARIGRFNALGHACLLGYYEEALRLLDLGATPQCEFDIYDGTPIYFHLTAVAGAPDFPSSRASKQKKFRLELVDRLIEHGIDVNQQGADGTAALMEAASFHRVDVVKALLYSGADVRLREDGVSGFCALDKAVAIYSAAAQKSPRGHMLNTVQALLEAMTKTPVPRLINVDGVGSDTSFDTTGDMDISKAFRMVCSLPCKHEDKLEVVALLLKYDKTVQMANVETNLVYASMVGTNFDISDLLLENGFNRPCEKQFEDLIQQYIDNDIAEGLRHILNRFPDIAPRIRSGQFLYDAVDAGSIECAKLLINEGVSIDSRNEDGSSLLFAACMVGDTQTAELLLKNGADPDECTQDGDALTTVAALDGNRAMIRLLLDFGASVHSSPSGKPARHSNMGFLDIAISCGLIDAVDEIVLHPNYPEPTDEELSRHWQTIIHAPNSPNYQGLMLDTLIGSEAFDKDQIFTLTNIESGPMITTPLHLCAAVSVFIDRFGIIEELISNGANIHKCLPAKQDDQAHTPELKFKPKGEVGFEGTTPLEWAIEFSTIKVVRALLEEEVSLYDRLLSPEMEMAETKRKDLMLLYAKAACRRQKPKMFSFLFKKGLDNTICDEDGNTIVHMICDYVETFWPNDEPEWTMEFIAERSAFSLIACLKWGVTYQLKNRSGVSGMERVLQILNYSGNCEFHQTLAKHWRGRIDYVEGSSSRLIAKFAAFDDSEEEELPDDELADDPDDELDEPGDEESNEDDSDDHDEPSNEALGPDNEMPSDEPGLDR
ncbi:ankyrin repeat-containing domain protein [Xylaria intraflava]|nr:ankyrin repeat-containing domain protein [Xylaria intraflava]